MLISFDVLFCGFRSIYGSKNFLGSLEWFSASYGVDDKNGLNVIANSL